MMQEHTKKVTSALYEMLKNEVPGTSPMTVASAHIGTSYETLRRRLKTGIGTLPVGVLPEVNNLIFIDDVMRSRCVHGTWHAFVVRGEEGARNGEHGQGSARNRSGFHGLTAYAMPRDGDGLHS